MPPTWNGLAEHTRIVPRDVVLASGPQQKYLGFTDVITFTLDPWQPSLYALLSQKVPPESVIDSLLRQPRGNPVDSSWSDRSKGAE